MNEFLLCENPMDPERLFVLKTTEPRCLIECDFIQEDSGETPEHSELDIYHEVFPYLNTAGDVEHWVLSVAQIYNGLPENSEVRKEYFSSLLDKVWQWFHEYLKWDEQKTNDAEHDDYLGSVN